MRGRRTRLTSDDEPRRGRGEKLVAFVAPHTAFLGRGWGGPCRISQDGMPAADTGYRRRISRAGIVLETAPEV